ncbi:hypothetical protein [Streptomyces sp. NPDC093544]|uniref:hypothetical protein n=1 Tax=Streptomyces sp. NPDC093544 TaxID=3155200 RepID=UPI0034369895
MVEPGPPLALPGVLGGADRDKTHGVLVVQPPHEPRPGRGHRACGRRASIPGDRVLPRYRDTEAQKKLVVNALVLKGY